MHVLSDEDTLALRAGGRLADPVFLGVLQHSFLEQEHFLG